MQKARVWGAFLLLGTVWGSSFLFIKIGLEDLEPFTLVMLRVGIGTLGLWTIIALKQQSVSLDRRTLAFLAFVGMFNTAIPFVLITWGEKFIASGVAGVLNGTTPLFALIVAHFALADERITRLRLLGLAIGFTGVLIIFSDELLAGLAQLRSGVGLGTAFGNVQGQLAVVLASVSYAITIVVTRRYLRHIAPLVLAGSAQVVAVVAVTISAFLFENPLATQISGQTWFAVGWLGLLGTCLAYILYFFIIREMGATRASLVTYMLPVNAFILGAIVLDEVITWQLFVGGALIIGGIAIVNRQSAQAAPAQSQPALEAAS